MTIRSVTDLPPGCNVLIDANIFIYALMRRSVQCQELLDRCTSEAVPGMTTIEVVNEVCHRLMVIEAAAAGIIDRPSAISLRRKRNRIQSLTNYWRLTAKIFDLNLVIIPLDEIRGPASCRNQSGLWSIDQRLDAMGRCPRVRSKSNRKP